MNKNLPLLLVSIVTVEMMTFIALAIIHVSRLEREDRELIAELAQNQGISKDILQLQQKDSAK